jgi:uncharacterized protein (DUF885 family)
MIKRYRLLSLVIIISTLVGACGKSNTPSQETLPTTSTPQLTALGSAAPVTPIATVVPVAPLTPASPGELSSGLDGLEFDAFVEESYRQLLSRNPETVLVLGLSQEYGTPTDQLTDISDEYIRQTQALELEVLRLLQQYDRSTMTPEQQLTYDIYAWYLGDKVKGHEFMYDDYPVNVTIFSVHLDMLQFFTDLRPVTNLQEAEDYIASLSQVDTKFEQLIDGLQRREQNHVMLPGFLVSWITGGLNDIGTSNARFTPYYTSFETKINALTNIGEAEKASLLTAAEDAIDRSVIPAYQELVKYFEHLQNVTTNDAGVWKFPDGEEYYTYLLRHYTSTDLTSEQIHELGLQELERIHAEMRSIFDQLGYPQDESIPELFSRVVNDSGTYSGTAIVESYEDIITTADQGIGNAFDLRPNIGVIVVGAPSGGYYTPPAVDGSRPGMFYAQNTGIQSRFSMPTLAYHEAIPGHHFQIAIAQQLDLPSFRRASDFTAYVEGWALYAERLVSELGLYGDDLYAELGRLQAEAWRAARLVVDTGIHSRQWTFNKAVDFMVENTGKSEYAMQGEVSRYISIPGQATAYYIGYAKILEARQRAMDEMGDQFDLKEFHNLLLGSGAMPLEILDQVISSYIQSKKDGG